MALAAFLVTSAGAAEIGQIKVANGQVTVEREGRVAVRAGSACGSNRPTC